jgi:hypothetical protein
MNKKLFQNDSIAGNSLIGFEIRGTFKKDEDELMLLLSPVLNRDILYSDIEYKLLNPTDKNAVLIKDGEECIIKTPLYNYFEAVYIIPKLFDCLNSNLDKHEHSYVYLKIGFNDSVNLSNLNVTKFVLNFNEKFILDNIVDLTKNSSIEKLSDFKPASIENCSSTIQKQLDGLKYNDDVDDNYGIDFGNIKLGYITLKYLSDIDYKDKKDDILKSIHHTIIALYNSSTVLEYTEDELKKIEKYNEDFDSFEKAFGCYELFREKYKGIKLTIDLDNDRSNINLIFPSIKDKLFNLVICNNIKQATVNYDSDVSRLQIKDVDLVKCYHLEGIDIVECDIRNCNVKKCDIYDCEIEDSFINDCNLFGYCDCVESKFKNCFISNNIKLDNSSVFGALGKFAGIINSGSIKNTTVIKSMADIGDKVKKLNINEIN